MGANVGLAIQCVGIVLLTLLSLSMRGSIKSVSLTYWTRAWASLSLALISLSRRMSSLNDVLHQNGEQWTGSRATISVSAGVCGFDSLKDLGDAIERADQAMYDSRQRLRQSRSPGEIFTAVPRQLEEHVRVSI